ncbi:24598_t:CDS:2, partial [Gigaspora rosea]
LLVDYTKKLENVLKDSNIESFDYSQFSEPERIGYGGYAVVYSTIFQGKKYALKSLNNNLSFGYKEFKPFMRELKLLHTVNHPNVVKFYGISRESQTKNFMLVLQFADGDISQSKEKYIGDISLNKENNSALSEYANIYIKCWSPALEQRPKLDNILEKLENILNKTTAEFVEISNQQIAQLPLYCSERLDSSNDILENINVNTHHEDNQNESNNDNFGNEDSTQSKDDMSNDLNEPCEVASNNELA